MRCLFTFLLFVTGFNLNAQSLEGSWRVKTVNQELVSGIETIMLYQNGYFVFTSKESGSNHFLGTGGGLYSHQEDGTYSETFDFNSFNGSKVGSTTTGNIKVTGDEAYVSFLEGDQLKTETWERVSDRKDPLTGVWVITGRKSGDEMISMTPGARRTVKILSGGRFQWIAFNSESRDFGGTGGGTYTAENGKYTEHIDFFSRDDARVGASLQFDFEVKDGKWHHSGLSSKGDPIYEIWSDYREAYLEKK